MYVSKTIPFFNIYFSAPGEMSLTRDDFIRFLYLKHKIVIFMLNGLISVILIFMYLVEYNRHG